MYFNKLITFIPGLNSNSRIISIISVAYYTIGTIVSLLTKNLFIFTLSVLWSLPFIIYYGCKAIADRKYKYLFVYPICFAVVLISSLVAKPVYPSVIQISDKSIEYDDICISHKLNLVTKPNNASHSKIEFVSENPDVAFFDGDTLYSWNDGKTYVYAKCENSETVSNKVPVIVKNTNTEEDVKAKHIIDAISKVLNMKSPDDESINKVKTLYEKSDDTVKEKVTNYKDFESLINGNSVPSTAEKGGDTVYISKSGSKYHKQSCSTLKGNGTPISLNEAIAKGKQPCKKCKP